MNQQGNQTPISDGDVENWAEFHMLPPSGSSAVGHISDMDQYVGNDASFPTPLEKP